MNSLYRVRQLDKKLAGASPDRFLVSPRKGWVATIRAGLGMTQLQLANRLGLSRQRVVKLEQGEVDMSLKLSTIASVARGLGCRFCYVLLPESGSFGEMVAEQARQIARRALLQALPHMALEDQAALDEIEAQVDLLAQELLHKNLRVLWQHEE